MDWNKVAATLREQALKRFSDVRAGVYQHEVSLVMITVAELSEILATALERGNENHRDR